LALAPRAVSVRGLRIGTGWVLFAYIATHLANHALGLFGLEAMEAGRALFLALWRSVFGVAALYGALSVHLGLALYAIYERRHLRMPLADVAQLALGLAIPVLLVAHIVGTHFASSAYGVTDSYTRMLIGFSSRPDAAIRQALLLVIAWSHGCIGVHFWLRTRPWYRTAAPLLSGLALLIPLLALLGFLEAMRDIAELARRPGWVRLALAQANEVGSEPRRALAMLSDGVLAAYAAAVGLTLAARRLRNLHERRFNSITVSYPGGRKVTAPRGYSILETSRFAGIAHASVCGGRGRCSTCRVRVGRGLDQLPAASEAERAVLERIGAPADVRLACQLRPGCDLSVVPLLPADAAVDETAPPQEGFAGQELEVCVMFADLRAFTRFSERKLPYDIVYFLNRYFESMSEAIGRAGGIANQFTGDGVMALFGVNSGVAQGCRDALEAAAAMSRALVALSAEFAGELETPLRMGIGLHAGWAVVGEMGPDADKYLTAVGDTVHVASRLQDLTRRYECPLIVSQSVASHARLDVGRFVRREISVRNRDDAVAIYVFDGAERLAFSGA